MSLSRYFAPAVLAASLGVAAVAAPAPAQAQSDDLVRVLVSVADVVMRGNQPYYRHGDYGYDDRLVMQRDRYGRPVYYRCAPENGFHVSTGNCMLRSFATPGASSACIDDGRRPALRSAATASESPALIASGWCAYHSTCEVQSRA